LVVSGTVSTNYVGETAFSVKFSAHKDFQIEARLRLIQSGKKLSPKLWIGTLATQRTQMFLSNLARG